MKTPSGDRRSARGSLDDFDVPIPGNVLKALEELGIEVIRVVDDEALAQCPKHLENTGKVDRHPSWSVRVMDLHLPNGDVVYAGTHNCLSCPYSGNFVRLVKDVTDFTWQEARAWVRARGGIERARMLLEARKRPTLVDTTEQINEASLSLLRPPPEWALLKRGISAESAARYEALWDPQKDCWVLPIRDRHGKLLGWQEKGEGNRYFLNHPRDVQKSDCLFGYEVLLDSGVDTAILLESPLDAPRLDTLGFEGGVAAYGVAVSDEQLRLLVKSQVRNVLFALDNDRDGASYSARLKNHWSSELLTFRFMTYEHTPAKDPGEFKSRLEAELSIERAIPKPLYRT